MAKALIKTHRKRGRPALPEGKAKRYPLNMRTTKEMKEKLESACRASGRSIAQEVELRMEESFKTEESLFGSRETYSVMRMLAGAIGIVEARTGQSWTTDYDTFVAVRHAIKRLLERVGPKMPETVDNTLRDWEENSNALQRASERLFSLVTNIPLELQATPLFAAEHEQLLKETEALRRALADQARWVDDYMERIRELNRFGDEAVLGIFPQKPTAQG